MEEVEERQRRLKASLFQASRLLAFCPLTYSLPPDIRGDGRQQRGGQRGGKSSQSQARSCLAALIHFQQIVLRCLWCLFLYKDENANANQLSWPINLYIICYSATSLWVLFWGLCTIVKHCLVIGRAVYFFNYLSHDMSEVPNKVNRWTGRADLGWFLQRRVQIDRAHGSAGAEIFKLKEELLALVDNLQTSVKRLPWVIGPEQGGQDGRP